MKAKKLLIPLLLLCISLFAMVGCTSDKILAKPRSEERRVGKECL